MSRYWKLAGQRNWYMLKNSDKLLELMHALHRNWKFVSNQVRTIFLYNLLSRINQVSEVVVSVKNVSALRLPEIFSCLVGFRHFSNNSGCTSWRIWGSIWKDRNAWVNKKNRHKCRGNCRRRSDNEASTQSMQVLKREIWMKRQNIS